MNLGLRGKVALVAASSRGLGRAIAEELAGEGMSVVMCAREEGRLREAAREVAAASGARVVPVVADVSKPGEARRLAEETLRAMGRVDVVVTNSGGPPPGTFESTPPEAWQAAFDILLASAVELIRAVLPGMKAGRLRHRTVDRGGRGLDPRPVLRLLSNVYRSGDGQGRATSRR